MATKKTAAAGKEKTSAKRKPKQGIEAPAATSTQQTPAIMGWDSASGVLDIAMQNIATTQAGVVSQEAIDILAEGMGKEEATHMAKDLHRRARLLTQIKTMSIFLALLRDPEYAIRMSTSSPEEYNMAMQPYLAAIISKVHEMTGAPVEQIANPKTRTEEQERLLVNLTAEEMQERKGKFMLSNYMQAYFMLEKEPSCFDDTSEQAKQDICRYAALYFFATRYDEIKPQEAQGLQESHIAELKKHFGSIDKFFADKEKAGDRRPAAEIFADYVLYNDLETFLDNIPRIFGAPPEKIEYPVDKINATIWQELEEAAKDGNGQFAFAMEKRGSGQEATLLYSINFDELEKETGLTISKNLTAFDKRVYIAVASIAKELDTDIMSLGQIYAAMGNKGKPTGTQLEKIETALTKMRMASVTLDNSQETKVNKGYEHVTYKGYLLPLETITAYINGAITDSAIHLLQKEPPLIKFARDRKQITTIPRALLETPLNQTNDSLIIEDYFIESIAQMKNGRRNHKMLYATIFEKCKITDRRVKPRAKDKIKRLLDFYVKQKHIKGYTDTGDGIEIKP